MWPFKAKKPGKPEVNTWCLLHVVDLRNPSKVMGPVVGRWTGKVWMLRVFNPQLKTTSFDEIESSGLDVFEWEEISSPIASSNRPRWKTA